MPDYSKNDYLHGISLEQVLEKLVDIYGWEKIADDTSIKIFKNQPTIKSCLKFLRMTPWAREKVEKMYIRYCKSPWAKK